MPESETAQSEFAPDAQEHEPAGMSSGEEPAPPADAPLETIAEGEQPSAAAEGALTADTTPDETLRIDCRLPGDRRGGKRQRRGAPRRRGG